jgi:hypothetical protein
MFKNDQVLPSALSTLAAMVMLHGIITDCSYADFDA